MASADDIYEHVDCPGCSECWPARPADEPCEFSPALGGLHEIEPQRQTAHAASQNLCAHCHLQVEA